jgi:hypothetical protein
VGGLIRGARQLGRLRMVLDSPELAGVLRRSGREMSEIASELGMTEQELVRRLHTLRGAAREELVARARQAAESRHTGGRLSHGNLMRWEAAGQPASKLEKLRTDLLARQDVGRVVQSLQSFGIPADRELVDAVKRYNFDSPGIGFYHDNFAAWERLARGGATVQDAQYLVHEMAEVTELRRIQERTGFDFMGRDMERMSKNARKRWDADFQMNYPQAHARALEVEYDFVAQEVARLTGGRVRIGRAVAAAVDPLRDEARLRMRLDGFLLIDHPDFYTWQARAREPVELGAGARERLGIIYATPTLGEVVGYVRTRGR